MKKQKIPYILTNNPYILIRGQAALIILAIMAIGMTMALSLSRQVITDVQISEQEEESAKAFSAAEAGIEEALRKLNQGETTVTVDPTDLGVDQVDVSILAQGGDEQFIYPTTLKPGETAPIWLRDHHSDGSLNEASGYNGSEITVCWQDNAAIEIIYFYQDSGGDYQIKRYALDPDGSRAGNNGFTNANIGTCPAITGLNRSYQLNLPGDVPIMLVVRLFYQMSRVGVATGGESLPAQGYLITSSGSVSQGDQEVVRRIKVFKSWNSVVTSLFSSIYGTGVAGN